MPFTVAGLAAELGIDPETLKSKSDVVSKYDGYFSQAGTQYADAAKLKSDAEALQAVIDQNITSFGVNEATTIQLQAQVEALKAAQKTLEEKGFKIDLNLPTLNAPVAKDPVQNLQELIVKGFTNINQAQDVNNRHIALFGRPMPMSQSGLADEAAAQRMSVTDYAERKFGFSAKETEIQAAATKAHDDAIAIAAVKAYQEKYPSTAGHPELNGGFPSNYPAMPKPMEQKDFKSFSNMSTREKISAMVGRAQERTTQATQ